jgi:hypothetical protein
VHVRDGALLDASFQQLRGTEAFLSLAVLERGSFRVRPETAPVQATISGSWQALVMEAMRLYDEARATDSRGAPASADLRPPSATRLASYRPSRLPPSDAAPGAALPQPPPLPREVASAPDSIELPLAEERPPSVRPAAALRSSPPGMLAARGAPPTPPRSGTVEQALRAAADAMRAGERDTALRVLADASRTWPDDRRVRANLARLERMKEGQP